MTILCCYKNVGETTKCFSERLKKELNVKKVAICGKLDPMACGLVTILTDDDTKLMDHHLSSIKTYKFEIVVGFSTDTDDVLGYITKESESETDIHVISNLVYEYCTIESQPYHIFSSKPVKISGKSVKMYNHMNEKFEIPEKQVKVYNIIQLDHENISVFDYKNYIYNKIAKIVDKNSFRVDGILSKYDEYFERSHIHIHNTYIKIPFIITVSSGFYIRMISNYISNHLNGIPVHICNIERIEII